MKNVQLVLLGFLTLPVFMTSSHAQTWVEDSYEDFADGRLDASGQNIYVSRSGSVRTIHRFDINQDGFIDVIFNSTHDSYAYIPPSVGTITKDRKIQRSELAVEGSRCVEIADLNRDGWLDAVFCPNPSGLQHPRAFLTILWGGEDGWPAHRSNGALPTHGPRTIAIADLNHDDWPDIVVLCNEAWMRKQPPGRIVRIFWGGEGGFLLTRRHDVGIKGAVDLTSGDFDGDGASDLAVLLSSQKVQFLWATEDREKPVQLPRTEVTLPGDSVKCVEAIDFNQDGFLDLAVGTSVGRLYVVPGQSGRRWGKAQSLPAYDASHIAFGDIDADKHVDLVLTKLEVGHAMGGEAGAASSDAQGTVHILWGGDSSFSAARSTTLDVPYAAATAVDDVDGDGKVDVAIAVYQGTKTYKTDSLIFYGRGGRRFERGVQGVRTEGAIDVVITPATERGPARVVFANSNGGTLNEKVPSLLYWGGADGFSADRVWRVPVNSGYEASAADLNEDGFVDLIVMNSGHSGDAALDDPHMGANILWGSDQGFSGDNRSVLREFGLGSSNVADVNKDGYLDVVLGAFEHGGGPKVLVIYLGSASGFDRSRRVAVPSAMRSTICAIADYNHDDWLDIAVSSYPDDWLRVFWGGAEGYSADRLTQIDIPAPIGLETADLNADGYLDLIGGSYADEIEGRHDTGTFIFWGSSKGFQSWNAQWLPGMTPIGYVVADFDADGFLDVFAPHYHSELTREALPCYLYWGSSKGFSRRRRTILTSDSAHDGLAADFDRDGRLDLAVSCHSRDGSHHTNSRIYYNDGKRFASPRVAYLPTHGTHWMWIQDMGHIEHRRWEQTYESSVYRLDRAMASCRLASKADTPTGTELRFHIRASASQAGLQKASWRAVKAGLFTLNSEDRFLQYRTTFVSGNGDLYPVLDRVTIELSAAR